MPVPESSISYVIVIRRSRFVMADWNTKKPFVLTGLAGFARAAGFSTSKSELETQSG